MEQLLYLFKDTIAGSAETVARAADERQRQEGLLEAPDEHAHRAEAMRDRLRSLHAGVAETASQATAEDAATLLALAREILGGVWGVLWSDVSETGREAYAQRHTYARQGAAWAWGLLGRSLGVPA